MRFEKHIPDWKIQKIQANDFSLQEKLDAIDKIRAWFEDPETVSTLDLIKIGLLFEGEKTSEGKALAERVVADSASIKDVHYRARLKKTLVDVGVDFH
jgi:hypothetical protein